jgi:hypothetical protein
MSAETDSHRRLEIAHVLFVDIVGYSKLLLNEQSQILDELNEVVRSTEQVRGTRRRRATAFADGRWGGTDFSQ